MGKLINDKIHMKYVTSNLLQTTHTFGQQYILSWISVSLPDVFCLWRYWALNFVYKVYGKIPQFACIGRIGPYLTMQMSVVGCRLALVPLFAFMVGCIIRSVRAYHLMCQHDKLPLVLLSFCMNFVQRISQKRNQQSSSNFDSTFTMIRNRYNSVFTLITQP